MLCGGTASSLGAMQQSGYKNGGFIKWLRRKDNLFFNRLSVLALCLALCTAITALCFSYFSIKTALYISAVPFFTLLSLYCFSSKKYALKVPTAHTGRWQRLFAAYCLLTASVAYFAIAGLQALAVWNGSKLYNLVAYAPFALVVLCLPFLLCAANAIVSVFENARNRKFVKRAGQVLDETAIIRVGIVGSYGKTSVKNILKTLLKERYSVVGTPSSYNTPIGIAKTVFSNEFDGKQILIAEMGARKQGDIKELCQMVKPDYAVFTGVCNQHVATFGTLENVLQEKSEILRSTAKKVVCGGALKEQLSRFANDERVIFVDETYYKDVRYGAMETEFTLVLEGEERTVKTSLLGESAIENITLAAALCKQMGLSMQEIADGIAKLQPIEHRLQPLQANGVYILDDGYNCNEKGAVQALLALSRFGGKKYLVTPGIVECGVLEESVNGALGKSIAQTQPDRVILVGETLVTAVKNGYLQAGGDGEKLITVKTLSEAQSVLKESLNQGDAVLFMNDLPDVY